MIALSTRAVGGPRAMVILSTFGLMFGDGLFLWGHIVTATAFLALSVCLLGAAWVLIHVSPHQPPRRASIQSRRTS